MKSCPACNRTFDDTLTYCLDDGSLLSAPFDRQPTEPVQPPDAIEKQATVTIGFDAAREQETVVRRGTVETVMTPTVRSKKPLLVFGIAGAAVLLIAVAIVGVVIYQQLTAGASPTEAVQAGSEAVKSKNVAALKNFFSQPILTSLENQAIRKGVSLDEYLKNELDTGGFDSFAGDDVRNEMINGDAAMVEIKVDGKWRTILLQRLNGEWRYIG
jgi:hypothetical protein